MNSEKYIYTLYTKSLSMSSSLAHEDDPESRLECYTGLFLIGQQKLRQQPNEGELTIETLGT